MSIKLLHPNIHDHFKNVLRLLKKWEEPSDARGHRPPALTLWLDEEGNMIEGYVPVICIKDIFPHLDEGWQYYLENLVVMDGSATREKKMGLHDPKRIERVPGYTFPRFPTIGHRSKTFAEIPPPPTKTAVLIANDFTDYTGVVVNVQTVALDGKESIDALLLKDLDNHEMLVHVHDMDRMPPQLTPRSLIRAELQGLVVLTITRMLVTHGEVPTWREVRTTNGTRVIHHSVMSEFREYRSRFSPFHRPIGVCDGLLDVPLRYLRVPIPPRVRIFDLVNGHAPLEGVDQWERTVWVQAKIRSIPPQILLINGVWTPFNIPPNFEYKNFWSVEVECEDHTGVMAICFSDGPMSALMGCTADEFSLRGPHLQLEALRIVEGDHYTIEIQCKSCSGREYYEAITLWNADVCNLIG